MNFKIVDFVSMHLVENNIVLDGTIQRQ